MSRPGWRASAATARPAASCTPSCRGARAASRWASTSFPMPSSAPSIAPTARSFSTLPSHVPSSASPSPRLERRARGHFLDRGYAEAWAPEPVRDICISGNGEPTALSFPGRGPRALRALSGARIRKSWAPASLVLITNSTGFLDPRVSEPSSSASARDEGLVVWAKLDAGSEGSFRLMSGTRGRPRARSRRASSPSRADRRRHPDHALRGRWPSPLPTTDIGDYSRPPRPARSRRARASRRRISTPSRGPAPGGRCAALADERAPRCAPPGQCVTGTRSGLPRPRLRRAARELQGG